MHLVWKHDAKPPNPVPCVKAQAKAYTRPLSLPLCREWTFSNFSLQNIRHLASCRTGCLKNRWKEFKRWIRLPTPISFPHLSFPHLLPPSHPQLTADAANARSALVPSNFIQLMNDLIVKLTNVDGKFMETSWISDLLISYSDKVRIMSYHHFHQQESSVPNCNHHSPTSAQVPQPTRCPKTCTTKMLRLHVLKCHTGSGDWRYLDPTKISGVDFWSNRLSTTKVIFLLAKMGEYSPVPLRFPAMTLPNIILAPQLAQIFPMGLEGTEAHGTFIAFSNLSSKPIKGNVKNTSAAIVPKEKKKDQKHW